MYKNKVQFLVYLFGFPTAFMLISAAWDGRLTGVQACSDVSTSVHCVLYFIVFCIRFVFVLYLIKVYKSVSTYVHCVLYFIVFCIHFLFVLYLIKVYRSVSTFVPLCFVIQCILCLSCICSRHPPQFYSIFCIVCSSVFCIFTS